MNDIRARHRVLHGSDPFAALRIDAAELRRRLREVLLNLALRLRERYALVSLREEQLARVLASEPLEPIDAIAAPERVEELARPPRRAARTLLKRRP